MTRDQAKILDRQIRDHSKNNGVSVDWMVDTGEVVLKRDGTIKLSYSIRTSFEDAEVFKRSVIRFLTTKSIKIKRIVLTNMLDTYRSQVKVTVLI